LAQPADAAGSVRTARGEVVLDLLEALVLGIVQGLTEFLPISSSAHLRIVPAILGWNDPGAAFTAVIQIGTLAAVLAYFRRDIVRIGLAWSKGLSSGKPLADVDARMGWMMIVGTVPIVVCGLLFKDAIETTLRSLYVVAGALIVLALLLAAAEMYMKARAKAGKHQKLLDEITWPEAIAIGLAQTMALVPGSSRSGVTITAGLFAGLSRDTAARFSFLLSLPSVLAAGVYQLYSEREALLGSQENIVALAVATLAALISGYASIAFLLYYLKTRTTFVFVFYRIALGCLILYWLASGSLAAE
jgi:undecaprenyl-diphosphatase